MVIGTVLFAAAAFCENDGGFYAISFAGRLMQGVADGMICVVIPSVLSIEFPENNAKY